MSSISLYEILGKKDILIEALRKQESLITNKLFDPYDYFGISKLTNQSSKKTSKSPFGTRTIKKNCYSMINTKSFSTNNTEPSLLNGSFAHTNATSQTKDSNKEIKHCLKKPFHLKIDLQAYTKKKNSSSSLEIGSSRSASKLYVKTLYKTPQNNDKKKNFCWKKKSECNLSLQNPISKFKENSNYKEKPEKKKEISNITNTLKGLDKKYQNTYLSFIKANKKKI